jgi:SAM-dependent methyltransferase
VHAAILDVLRCPETGARLRLEESEEREGQIYAGRLVSEGNGKSFAIQRYIPRFVPPDNYAGSFGMQWNLFCKTQLDSHSGHPISASRFWQATGWKREELRGQWVLDIGCGAGRFAEIALQAGANVIALDYSDAVDACFENLKDHPNLHVIQGDIYHLPLCRGFFPFVYSLGVLQHTPDVAAAFASLPEMLAEGGRLAVDVYERTLRGLFHPRVLLRPITKRIPRHRLLRSLQRVVPPMYRLSCVLRRVPVAGKSLMRLVPVANYAGVLPLSSEQLVEWALLDTFDWLSPRYDQPQTATTLRTWLVECGLDDVEVEKAGHLVGRGRRTHASGN